MTRVAPPYATALNAPLPDDVEAGGLSRFAAYQRFGAFTWPWFVGRAMVFWPLAAAYGTFIGLWHASAMTTYGDAIPLGSRAIAASIVAVSAGPLIAVAIRYRRLPYQVERALVVLAVLGGLFIVAGCARYIADYHSMLMARFGHGAMPAPHAVQSVSRLLADMLGKAPRWIVWFLVGGGPELLSYLTERRRLAERERKRDLVRLRRDKADSDLRLAVLQAQVEPHFLFNTLASVRALVDTAPGSATATIDALSDYLRSTLPKLREGVGAESASLGEQVEICRRYLELMNIRMGGRITVVADVPPELARLAFPPLLLISLVENAVKHGVEPKPGPGLIAIRARLVKDAEESVLEVAVEDDGAGLSGGVSTGLGLSNVRAQLEHRFASRAALDVAGRPDGGVRASIRMPASPT